MTTPLEQKQNQDSQVAHPGEVLRNLFMNPLGITAYRLSKELGVTPITVSHLLRGKRAVSATMAARLGVFFDVPACYWLHLQANHDLCKCSSNGDSTHVRRTPALDGHRVKIEPVFPEVFRVRLVKERPDSAGREGSSSPVGKQPQARHGASPKARASKRVSRPKTTQTAVAS